MKSFIKKARFLSSSKSKATQLAKAPDIKQGQAKGQSESFDLLGIHADSPAWRKYFGEVSIHFASGSPPLLLPITESERSKLQLALLAEDSFIQLESLDNRIVFIRRKAIADAFFSSEAYDDYGPENDYGAQYLGIYPDENFWHIVEHLDCLEIVADEFGEQEINEALKKAVLDDNALDELIANGSIPPEKREHVQAEIAQLTTQLVSRACHVIWQIPGLPSRCATIHDNKALHEAFSMFMLHNEQDMLHLAPDGYHREIFLNLSALDFIAIPAHKYRRGGLESTIEEMDELEQAPSSAAKQARR